MLWRTRSIRESILATLLPNRHSNPTSVRSVDRNGHGQSLTRVRRCGELGPPLCSRRKRDSLRKVCGKVLCSYERCTHRGGPLSEGAFDGGVIKCLWHFRQFDLKSGEVRGSPLPANIEN